MRQSAFRGPIEVERGHNHMNSIIYMVGLIVIVLAILSLIGLA
jgi:hypothetical protein